jgi:hypothetical protein
MQSHRIVPMSGQPRDAFVGFRAVPPSAKTTRGLLLFVGSGAGFGALFTILALTTGIGTAGDRILAWGLTLLMLGALGFVWIWLWSRNVRLVIGEGQVGYRNFFGRTRLWSRGEINRVVSMEVNYGKSSQAARGIYCFGVDGRRLLLLSTRAWPPDDLNDFIAATACRLELRTLAVTAKDARREFPNAFGWGSQHVMLLTSFLMLGGVVLAVAGYWFVSSLVLK